MDSRSLQISLVDMAGSERVKRSEVSGQGFKEAVSINKSLSALLDVINALSKGKTDKSGVPYRAHPLTQVSFPPIVVTVSITADTAGLMP